MSIDGVSFVDDFTTVVQKLLAKARVLKPDGAIEPALTLRDLREEVEDLEHRLPGATSRKYAGIETACRNIFYALLASTSIEEQSFGEVWNLLDILSILSDLEHCEPSLLFWLVEELLDTQTISGCRIVFDYLDPRRELLTARHFKQKNLVILRACNELLRRLSRAEDTVFCGRVFIFLFQSFPLGDKSSVNLRGEYHVENVTAYEDIPSRPKSEAGDAMEVELDVGDRAIQEAPLPEDQAANAVGSAVSAAGHAPQTHNLQTNGIDGKSQVDDVPDMNTLYPIFWSLQESFSTPTRLFDDTNLRSFKRGLEITLQKFKQVQENLKGRGATKLPDERDRGAKRKQNSQEDHLSSSFNPKYLTSRDLFDLEISDLAFQRHILVQALILIDFMLSLTAKARKKLEYTSNKSVLYNFTLDEDNSKWASTMRSSIAAYLQDGLEGKFYFRMVDTVLSRDKNWVHWKAEGCPPIERNPVSADDFAEAEKGAQKACANKRLRPMPMGSLDLSFLSDGGDADGMEKLKAPERYTIPTLESFERPIADDEFDIEMARNAEEKQLSIDARASKLWRALRIASKSKLNLFEKIDDGNNIKAFFVSDGEDVKDKIETNGSAPNLDQATKENLAPPLKENLLSSEDERSSEANGVDALSGALGL